MEALVREYGEQGQATPLKELISTEMGKRLPEADIEVIESSDMLAFFAKSAAELLRPRVPNLNQTLWATKRSVVELEPLGVVGVIKPWNYPLELPIWAIGPALVAGNTVVFKPSEHSTLVGLEIGRLFHEAGLPAGVLNIVTGDGSTGRYLVEHEDVNMIAFTGSVATGRQIAIECAKRIRKCSLELGGNDAAIVDADVDLELAANGIVWGAFCNSGQVCVRAKRIFVHHQMFEALSAIVLKKTAALRAGIDFGPLVSEKQLMKVENQIADAVSKGAKVAIGGHRISNFGGFFLAPTVLLHVSVDANLMHEECFGPVLPMIRVEDAEEGVRRANESSYGLGASVWTSKLPQGESIARKLDAGMVWVNDVNVAFPEAPWGGTKNSGLGTELSEWGLYEYVRPKHINVETSSEQRRAWWYPY